MVLFRNPFKNINFIIGQWHGNQENTDKILKCIVTGYYKPTYPMQHSPCESSGFQLAKKIPAFYGTRRFITIVTSARQVSLS
jgi:hypothetical protein